jgi:hypothetical protein
MRRYRYEMIAHDPLRLNSCLVIAGEISEEIQLLARNGELEIMQDTASCMTSALVVFFQKVRDSVCVGLADLVLSLTPPVPFILSLSFPSRHSPHTRVSVPPILFPYYPPIPGFPPFCATTKDNNYIPPASNPRLLHGCCP